jgi:hypothetical protein
MTNCFQNILRAAAAIALLACATAPLFAMPSLGSAVSFGVLAKNNVSSANATIIVGHVGSATASSVTGFPPGLVNRGTVHSGDAMTIRALADVTTAHDGQAGEPCDVNVTDQDLGDRTLGPGVYCSFTPAQLHGTLTLDAGNDPTAVFLFQLASTLDTAVGSTVQMINQATQCNVWWVVIDDVRLGAESIFAGNVISFSDIAAGAGTAVNGRLVSKLGSITLDTTAVESTECGPIEPSAVAPSTWGRVKTLYSY